MPDTLWHDNEDCPQCGAPVDPEIRAAETGLRYCSHDCARAHINHDQTPYRCGHCGDTAEVEF